MTEADLRLALDEAGIDTTDLVGLPMVIACREINKRLLAAGCDQPPAIGEPMDEAVRRIRAWASRLAETGGLGKER